VRLSVKRLDPAAQLPTRAYESDAGYDLYAIEDVMLEPGGRASVGTGIGIELPRRHAGLVLPRSGLAAKHGITLANAPGLIDEGYRGEVRVLLLNTDGREPFSITAGDRIAQLVIVRVETPEVYEVAELESTERAAGGFGSSGR
jgi:dUTP pyrophosphatase